MKQHLPRKILLLCLIFLCFSRAVGFSEGDKMAILSFQIEGQAQPSQIDTEKRIITIMMPEGTDLTALAPAITLSEGAMINPQPDRAMDFSEEQTYVLISPSGKFETYRVVVVAEGTVDTVAPEAELTPEPKAEPTPEPKAEPAPLEPEPEAEGNMALLVSPEYDGLWVSAEDYGFSLYLPEGWSILPSEEAEIALAITDPTATYSLIVEQVAGEGFSMDEMYEVFAEADSFDNVQKLIINGYSIIHYRAPSLNMRAFATHLWDPQHVYFFKFTPADDQAFTRYTEQIMATLSPAI